MSFALSTNLAARSHASFAACMARRIAPGPVSMLQRIGGVVGAERAPWILSMPKAQRNVQDVPSLLR